jgi:hypothetical protein
MRTKFRKQYWYETLWIEIQCRTTAWIWPQWYYYLIWGCSYGQRKRWGRRVENWNHLMCRIRCHPCGPIFFNPGGLEPDGHCKNCGDEIA